MPNPIIRAILGFLAAVVSVLTFHQGMWEILHLAGMMPPPYPTGPVPPFGVPLIVDLCFWGGVWGVVFGLILPALPRAPMPLLGLGLGIAAALTGIFIVPLIKGTTPHPSLGLFEISFLINGFWGIGVGIILPILLRGSRRSSRRLA